jgi:hypothetical protein
MSNRLPASALLALGLCAAAPAAARAQTPAAAPATRAARAEPAGATDYSGTWELNVAASDFGPVPGPTRATMTVVQAGNALTQTNVTTMPQTGEQKLTNTLTIGGPAVEQDLGGARAMTAAAWEGGVLTFRTTLDQQGTAIPVASRWTLAPGGRLLTVDRVITTPVGELVMRMVFDRR